MTEPTAEVQNDLVKQSIEELQKRFQDLNRKKIEAETNLKNATQRLDELKVEALSKYGTDDITELKQKLTQMKAENEEKRAKYQKDLDQIESGLAEVETQFAAEEAIVEQERT